MLGSLEQEVISSLKGLRKAPTGAVLEDLRARKIDVAYTTVATILTRLYEKGLIKRSTERHGRGARHVYAYLDIENEYIEHLLGGLATTFGREGVVHLAERLEDLTPDELERMRKRLKDDK